MYNYYYDDGIKIRHILGALIAAPILWAMLWLACAFGSVWEAGVRCENGYQPACINTQNK